MMKSSQAPSVERLIERLESASAGSRALDEAIATEIWGPPKPSGNVGHSRTLVWWDRGVGRSIAPEFTVSLDDALTLIPLAANTWFLELSSTPLGAEASVQRNYVQAGHWSHEGKAPSPALAMCIAALRARQASPPDIGSPPGETSDG